MTEAAAKKAAKEFTPTTGQKSNAQKLAKEVAGEKNINPGKGSIIIKPQLCGKYCGTCPHGPYAWHVYNGDWTYIGSVGGGIGTGSVGKKSSETETKSGELPKNIGFLRKNDGETGYKSSAYNPSSKVWYWKAGGDGKYHVAARGPPFKLSDGEVDEVFDTQEEAKNRVKQLAESVSEAVDEKKAEYSDKYVGKKFGPTPKNNYGFDEDREITVERVYLDRDGTFVGVGKKLDKVTGEPVGDEIKFPKRRFDAHWTSSDE